MEDPLPEDDVDVVAGSGAHSFRQLLGLATFLGDMAVFLIFAVIGRASHHAATSDAALGVAGTAAPFMTGWLIGALVFGGYKRETLQGKNGLLVVVAQWTLGAGIGLAIRSALERRIVPVGFILVTFLFNLALLLIWRSLVLVLSPRIRL